MSEKTLLEITQLGMAFPVPGKPPAVIVEDFNLKVQEGEFVCLIGQSGCGKSTVLSIVMGLVEASVGGVIIDDKEIDGPGTDRGVVFQAPSLFPWMTAEQNVLLAVNQVHPDKPKDLKQSLARGHLDRVGLKGSEQAMPDELSAGMKQRVGIARAFALEPKTLLLDEPFSLLDALTRMELQDELIRIWEETRTTVLMVTHDVDEALLLADRIVMMTQGPKATVGGILNVPFPRPRLRAAVLDHPDYYILRDQLTGFLEGGEPLPESIRQPGIHHPSLSYKPELAPSGRIRMFPVSEEL